MEAEKYNGWTNYETWCAHLWMSSDEGTNDHWEKTARWLCGSREGQGHPVWTPRQWARYTLAARMKDETDDLYNEMVELARHGDPAWPGMFNDLLTSALERINWDEVAGAFMPEETK